MRPRACRRIADRAYPANLPWNCEWLHTCFHRSSSGVTLANRIAVSPMSVQRGRCSGERLAPETFGVAVIVRAGVVIVEVTAVEPEGRIRPACLPTRRRSNESSRYTGAGAIPSSDSARPCRAAKPRCMCPGTMASGSSRRTARGSGLLRRRSPSAKAGWRRKRLTKRGWPASAAPLTPPRGAPTGQASIYSNCTGHTVTCCTAFSRRSPTGAATVTAAASTTACGFRSK